MRSHHSSFAAGRLVARTLILAALMLSLGACSATRRVAAPEVALVDARATRQTKALYANLQRITPDAVLFGHQDDLAYGVTWWREDGRSDVKDVAGSYPAVYGWELGDLELGAVQNLDGVNFRDMRRWIRQGYGRGGVITISWHMNNPATGGNAWDTTRAVHVLLPGGEKHAEYAAWLDRFAEFAKGLGKRGFLGIGRKAPAPVIFRPFHEHTGSWFWWGKGHLSPEEYVQLWRFTVTYLRDVKGVHNLLYAFSTDAFDSEEQYLEFYPGDDYVDVLGFDDYGSLRTDEGVALMSRRMRKIVEMAESRNKIAALTETGLEGIPVPNWWTGRLLQALNSDEVTRRIVYALVWRNANQSSRPGHHYAPYAGHVSAADFAEMRMHPLILFEDELPELYK